LENFLKTLKRNKTYYKMINKMKKNVLHAWLKFVDDDAQHSTRH